MIVGSLFRVNLTNLSKSRWVGLQNFVMIFTKDVEFQKAIYNTNYLQFYYGRIAVGSYDFNGRLACQKHQNYNLAQTMVFTPHIASLVSISILWIAMLNQTVLSTSFGSLWHQRSGLVVAGKYFALFGFAGYGLERHRLLCLNYNFRFAGHPAYVYEAAKLDKASKCGLSSALPFRSLRQPCLLSLLPNLSIPLRCLPQLKL